MTEIVLGRVAGTWKRVMKKKDVVITASLFTSLKRAEESDFAAAVERYGQFVNRSVVSPEAARR